ncbi:hypothetical protein RND81_06G177200 [Saponaria officinalis]|uniref:Uncharacterized protein n=1 Tax=Saponaria officinalis TaxID=3572 RepID=A0AAW1KBP0_SAPOF
MAKAGKLGKLLKKMQSIGRTSMSQRSNDDDHGNSLSRRNSTVTVTDESPARNVLPVYVGKTRRCYMVNSDVVDHPLFRELVERSTVNNGYCEEISVGCEVVLFEHLLWMLENADPQPESLDELVDFYAC